jgi:hypothetical protein
METKVLLRLIKDDIRLLEEINGTFITEEELTHDEVEVALTRARSLVAEFEMLSRNVAHQHGIEVKPEGAFKSIPPDHVYRQSKESDVQDKESGMIVLEEEEVLKPKAEEESEKSRIEAIPVAGKTNLKEKTAKATKPEKPAKVLVHEGLFEEVRQNNGKSFDERPVEKHELVNELLSTDKSERKFEGMPLKSIRDGIAINDRYLYTKELFGNDAEKYEEAVTALDGLATIEEAVSYLKQNFKWNKTEAGEKFLALVKRRFTK